MQRQRMPAINSSRSTPSTPSPTARARALNRIRSKTHQQHTQRAGRVRPQRFLARLLLLLGLDGRDALGERVEEMVDDLGGVDRDADVLGHALGVGQHRDVEGQDARVRFLDGVHRVSAHPLAGCRILLQRPTHARDIASQRTPLLKRSDRKDTRRERAPSRTS
eukprot:2429903-Rhodomonas_salina.2